MAQDNNTYTTSLEQVGQYNPAVDKPVIDTSEGEKAQANLTTLAKLTQVGVTAYDGYKDYTVKQEVGQEILGEIDAYKNQSPSWNSLPFVQDKNKEENDTKINGVLTKLDADTKVITNGFKQGRITVFQSEMRIKRILQEAIKNNPGRVDVITRYSKQLLANAGLSTIYAADTAFARDQASNQAAIVKDYQKYAMELRKKFGTDLIIGEDGLIDYVATAEEAEPKEIKFSKAKKIKSLNESRVEDLKAEIWTIKNKGWDTELFQETAQDIRTYSLELFESPDADDPKNIPKLINQLGTYIDQQMYELLDPKAGFGRYMSDPDIKAKFAVFEKQIEAFKTRTKDWKIGKDAKEALEYHFLAAKAIDDYKSLQYTSPNNIKIMQTITQALNVLPAGDNLARTKLLESLKFHANVLTEGLSRKAFDREYESADMFYGKGKLGVKLWKDMISGSIDTYNNTNNSTEKIAARQSTKDWIIKNGNRWNSPNNTELTNTASLTSLEEVSGFVLNPDNEELMSKISKDLNNDGELGLSVSNMIIRSSDAVRDNVIKIGEAKSSTLFTFDDKEPGKLSATITNREEIPENLKSDANKSINNTNRVLNYINIQYKLDQWSKGEFGEINPESWNMFLNTYYPQMRKQ